MNNNIKIYPIILCGGVGSRLWPLSRKSYPKQFLNLFNDRSLLQEAALRVNNSDVFTSCVFLGNIDYKFLIKNQIDRINIKDYKLILEPYSKNTAPAAGIAALKLVESDSEAVMLIMPSDHYIGNNSAYLQAIKKAYCHALNGKIITFGIVPNSPHTGYGYMREGNPIAEDDNIFFVKEFVEKPDEEKAREYIASNKYSWNSGMFMVKAKTYLKELSKYRLDIYNACINTLRHSKVTDNEVILDAEKFLHCPAESIDYAVMESTNLGCVVKADMDWDDIGSWDNVWDINSKDESGNVCKGEVIIKECRDSYFFTQDKKLITAIGLKDIIIIQTGNATLVLPKSRAQDVKKLVSQIEAGNREIATHDTKVAKPWGSYEVYADKPDFKIKKIIISPGNKISLQSHSYRAEHWIVIKGMATVTRGKEKFDLQENESTFIRPKEVHRLENKQNTDLHIIEVQTGSYFGEDDIIRYDKLHHLKV
ncbi:mannose-1-phosphate guanylyltransferase/mannose- 6-phosphate isomerase [endosymbiont of Acanthamoeba sp. UWC8]|uniref:mannose-1-phosphate guanylyltransferase/mannose-6-phosphate isomerase n=1 Tax=endosymbiont of Acanthamoeba sp. UWC8 TaxID=86106 RepID=UPI0004D142EE|nr:mannose-1-phosphate guanylyltransferase/mannose-6-phosphate isomerase [endosymbiont of Acanthamoeba sp. UWC8]AIF82005.1 mannose-1-phosphate guanylyltransferase/mannose- 6-phosphate isomerase [endosymbiont of Acanthamoeba sp. UWC8]